MELDRKLKIALDESRLLILGAQVLFGFQFQGVFQEKFAELSSTEKSLHGVGTLLLMLSVTLLITPSMYHQIAFGGESRKGALDVANRYAGASLLPLTLGLGASAIVTLSLVLGSTMAIATALILTATASVLFYGLGFILKKRSKRMAPAEQLTPLKAKIEQMLTEARVLIPGAQALLGFQFVAILTNAFGELPVAFQHIHVVALCATSIAAMILMTPAAVHRIAFDGEDDQQFFVLGARLVILGALPMAIGIAADIVVVFYKISNNGGGALTAGLAAFALLISAWFVAPFWRRRRECQSRRKLADD